MDYRWIIDGLSAKNERTCDLSVMVIKRKNFAFPWKYARVLLPLSRFFEDITNKMVDNNEKIAFLFACYGNGICTLLCKL